MSDERSPIRFGMRLTQRGFSLLEAFIVLAVIAVFAALVYPYAEENRQDERRAQAREALHGLAAQLHARQQVIGTYAGAAGSEHRPLDTGTPWQVPAQIGEPGGAAYYHLHIATANARGFEIRAVPQGVHADDPCGTLTLTAKGIRGMINAEPDRRIVDCWPPGNTQTD